MKCLNMIRIVNGLLLLIGLLFFKPLAYFVAAMMIVAGLTGYCLMERLLQRVGFKETCSNGAKKTKC